MVSLPELVFFTLVSPSFPRAATARGFAVTERFDDERATGC